LYKYVFDTEPQKKIDFNILDPGPVLALVNEWYKIASTSVGIDPREAKHLKTMISNAGFEDVKKQVMCVPVGEWPTDEGLFFLIYY
jgi:hypothetical protein